MRYFKPAELLDLWTVGVVAEKVRDEGPVAHVEQLVAVLFIGGHSAETAGGGGDVSAFKGDDGWEVGVGFGGECDAFDLNVTRCGEAEVRLPGFNASAGEGEFAEDVGFESLEEGVWHQDFAVVADGF